MLRSTVESRRDDARPGTARSSCLVLK